VAYAATRSPAPTVIDSPIVGTYTTSFTKDELVGSPHLYDAGEINDGNWGAPDVVPRQGMDSRPVS